MKKLDNLTINVSTDVRSIGFGNISYKASVTYEREGSMLVEEYSMGNDTLNLDSLFRQIKQKVYKLENDDKFGTVVQL